MLSHHTLKLIRSLDSRKGRSREGLFVAEGPKLVGELLATLRCERLFATNEWLRDHAQQTARVQRDGGSVEEVTPEELARASFLQTPQQVLALFGIPSYQVDVAEALSTRLNLALDEVQDPGNLGTIVRVADWFGIEDIWCSQGTADIWNPKAVQATMGGLARVRVHYIDLYGLLASRAEDVPVYGTSLSGTNLWQLPLQPHGIIVMGNEGRGVSAAVDALCTRRLFIPSFPPERTTTESLNVAMATGIVLAEFRRRTNPDSL